MLIQREPGPTDRLIRIERIGKGTRHVRHDRAARDHSHNICHGVIMETSSLVARVVEIRCQTNSGRQGKVFGFVEHIVVAAERS